MAQLNDKKVHFYANSKTMGGYVAEEVSAMAIELQERRSAAEAQGPVYQFIYNNPYEEGYAEWVDCNEHYFNGVPNDYRRVLYTAPQTVAVPDDLIMQIRRLVHALKNSNPNHSLVKSVPDYMKRMGYWHVGDCLRDAEPPEPVVVPDDTRRLDWLDAQNKRLNEYYGTSYGWKFDANFQRNAMMLNDSNYPVMNVRQAIDKAMRAASQEPTK